MGKKVYLLLNFMIVLSLLNSCSSGPEPSIETERKERDEIANGLVATFWKGFKVTYRSMPVAIDLDEIKKNPIDQDQIKKIGIGPQLQKLYSQMNISIASQNEMEMPEFAVTDLIAMSKELYDLQSNLDKIDEDDFPTCMEISDAIRDVSPEDSTTKMLYNSSVEHLAFALVFEKARTPKSWQTYELSKINPDEIQEIDLKMTALLALCIDHMRNDWNFMAEDVATKALKVLEGDTFTYGAIKDINKSIPSVNGMTGDEVFRTSLQGAFHLLRGYARFQIDKPDRENLAAQDIGSAIEKLNKIGINNELTWLPSAYVAAKNGNVAEAKSFVEKLEASKKLGDNEKSSIAEAKKLLGNNDADGASQILSSKTLFVQVGINFFFTEIFKTDFVTFFKNEAEKQYQERIVPKLNDFYNRLKKYFK